MIRTGEFSDSKGVETIWPQNIRPSTSPLLVLIDLWLQPCWRQRNFMHSVMQQRDYKLSDTCMRLCLTYLHSGPKFICCRPVKRRSLSCKSRAVIIDSCCSSGKEHWEMYIFPMSGNWILLNMSRTAHIPKTSVNQSFQSCGYFVIKPMCIIQIGKYNYHLLSYQPSQNLISRLPKPPFPQNALHSFS